MVRGGSWNNNQDNARCAYRNNNPDNSNNNVGFRVVSHTSAESGPAMPRVAPHRRRPRGAEAKRCLQRRDGAACPRLARAMRAREANIEPLCRRQ